MTYERTIKETRNMKVMTALQQNEIIQTQKIRRTNTSKQQYSYCCKKILWRAIM